MKIGHGCPTKQLLTRTANFGFIIAGNQFLAPDRFVQQGRRNQLLRLQTHIKTGGTNYAVFNGCYRDQGVQKAVFAETYSHLCSARTECSRQVYFLHNVHHRMDAVRGRYDCYSVLVFGQRGLTDKEWDCIPLLIFLPC